MRTHRPTLDCHSALRYKIMHLNALKEEQEEKISRNFKELYYSVQPGELLRNFTAGSAASVGNGIAKMGSDFLIRKLIGNRFGIKGYIASLVLEKVADFAITNTFALSSGLKMARNFFGKKKKEVPEGRPGAEYSF